VRCVSSDAAHGQLNVTLKCEGPIRPYVRVKGRGFLQAFCRSSAAQQYEVSRYVMRHLPGLAAIVGTADVTGVGENRAIG
jgi:hypothetical protein